MLARFNRYVEKQIAKNTWYDGAWYIGGYIYTVLGKWLNCTFMLYSAIPYAFLLLGYNFYLTVLFYRRRKVSPISKKKVWWLSWGYILSLILIYYAFIALSEANAHAAALHD